MIATLYGRVRRKLEDRMVLECAGVGYEVFLPPIALRQLEPVTVEAGDRASELTLTIYYHATRDQPRPVLIGFTSDLDKEFFEKLITVKDIGPMVAARALAAPVGELAAAIARQDEKYLRALPGIGPQKAKNIVAQLSAKVAKFALARDGATPGPAPAAPPAAADAEGLRELVWEVLVKQLGHRPSEASQLIADALHRRPALASAEELFDEIYRGAPGGATAAPGRAAGAPAPGTRT
jgi:Holliday junction DNA helicase RuvA